MNITQMGLSPAHTSSQSQLSLTLIWCFFRTSNKIVPKRSKSNVLNQPNLYVLHWIREIWIEVTVGGTELNNHTFSYHINQNQTRLCNHKLTFPYIHASVPCKSTWLNILLTNANEYQMHFTWTFLESCWWAVLPFKDIRGERFRTDVRHRVFLYSEVILFKSLSGCCWGSLVPVTGHLEMDRASKIPFTVNI